MAGFTFAHLAICIERAVATWHVQCYEQFTAKLGIFLLFPMFLLPVGWNLWIFHEEDFLANKAYCMSTSAKNSSRLLGMSYMLIGLDLLAICTDIVLYAVNKYQQKKWVLECKLLAFTFGKLQENRGLFTAQVFPAARK